MWFGLADGLVFVRSDARDGKVKRIRRDPAVLIAACDTRGRPRGPALAGVARVLDSAEQEARAERALREHIGFERRIYGLVRASWLDAAYIEISPRETRSHG